MRKLQLAFLASLLALSGCGGGGGGSSNNGGGVSSVASSASSATSSSFASSSASSVNAAEVALGAGNLPPDSGVAGASQLADDELSPENKTVALATDELVPL